MKYFFTAILIILGFYGNAQNFTEEIKNDFNEYSRLIADKNIDKALDYTNPKLFEIVPKEQMKSLLEAVYNMPNIEYKTGQASFINFDELKKIDGVNYVKFFIKSPIEMKFNDIELTIDKRTQMINNFEAKFGKGNVVFDEVSGFFKINAEKVIIASSDEKLVDWKFLTIDNPRMKMMLEKVIPSELLN